MNPLVLVSGAWHGAWCWPALTRELASRGVVSTSVEVLGFGGLLGGSPLARFSRPFDEVDFATEVSLLAQLTLDDVRGKLLSDIEVAVRAGGGPVAVVAHSISGFVVADAVQQAPELFASVTYLAAITPLVGISAAEYNVAPEMNESLLISALVGDPASIGAARCDFQGDPSRTIEIFYHDADPHTARQAVAMLASDVPFGINGFVEPTSTGIGAVPRGYIYTTEDRAIPLAMQQRVVHEIDEACAGSTPTRSLRTSHSPFLSQPSRLADAILDLTAGR